MLLAVCSVFALAIAAPFIHRVARGFSAPLFAILPASLFAYFLSLAPGIAAGSPIAEKWAWVPSLGANLNFYLDGLSLLFALLVTGIGAVILVFAGGYFTGDRSAGKFFCLLLFFMGAMLGIVLADNLIALFVFWELTSISSYLLIGYNHKSAETRAAALQALLVTGGGGLALLAGLILLGVAGGSTDISSLNASGSTIASSALYPLILFTILLGAFTKSAQVPFHFWLPNAMAAPAPVSAYLHSATMVKAGVFLLARLHPAIADSPVWMWTVTSVGAATMLFGATMGMLSTDLKRMLAYTTVSILGCLTMLLGIGTEIAIFSMAVLVLAHALYKGTLFLVAGTIEKMSGGRDARVLGGLFHKMPMIAIAGSLAALSMIGIPLFFGFVAKEALYDAALQAPAAGGLWLTVVIASSAMFVAVAILTGMRPFFATTASPIVAKSPPVSMWIGPIVLSLAGLVCFFAAPFLGGNIVYPTVSAISEATATIELKSWHGFNLVLALSLLTIAAGLGLYAAMPMIRKLTEGLFDNGLFGAARAYDRTLDGLLRFAQWQASTLQNGYLRRYILVTICVTTTGAGAVFILHTDWSSLALTFDLRVHEAALVIVMVSAIAILVRASSRLTAIVALGVLGYAVSLIFMLYGAPDLTMTQLCIETLSVVLFVFVLYRLPQFIRLSRRRTRLRDAVIASGVGALMASLVLVASSGPADSHLRQYYASNAYTEAFGRNVVNVILVDFRALDTLGEITVLAVAAIGVFALLKLRPPSESEEAA